MKRNVKNDKVLRAITIGLATMIAATSMPITVSAETTQEPLNTSNPEPTPEADPAPEAEPSSPEPSESGDETGEETVVSTDNTEPVAKEDSQTVSDINEAIEIVEEYQVEGDTIDAGTLEDLNDAKEQVERAEKELAEGQEATATVENAIAAIGDADKVKQDIADLRADYDKNATSLWHSTNKEVLTVNEDGSLGTQKELQLNNKQYYDNYKVARKEIEKALSDPGIAEEDREAWAQNVSEKLSAARAQIDKHDTDGQLEYYTDLLTAITDVLDEADAAVSDLSKVSDSIKDSKAAEASLNNAKKRADLLSDLLNTEYDFLEKFYSDYEKNSKSSVIVRDAEGKIDVVATAANVDYESAAWKICSPYDKGRAFMQAMIRYKLCEENDNIDPSSIKFGGQLSSTVPGDDGRSKRTQVTYKDKDGNSYTEYYNYVLKTEKFGDEMDIENGVVNLEKKDKNTGAKIEETNDGSKLDVDNVNEIKNAATASRIEAHSEASDAIDTALTDVATLKSTAEAAKPAADSAKATYKTLRDKIYSNGNLKFLRNALENTKKAYENSKASLDLLDNLFSYVKTELFGWVTPTTDDTTPGGITTPATDDTTPGGTTTPATDDTTPGGTTTPATDDTTPGGTTTPATDDTTPGGTTTPTTEDTTPTTDDTTSSTDGPTYDPGTGTLTIPGYEIPPITLPTTPAGVAGVRAAATRPSGVLGVQAPETKAEKTIANKTVVKPAAKKTVAQKGKKIADPETPLAATPFVDEDGMKIPWIWLLIIAALGAVGKKMYDEHKKKVQAEEQAKKYND